MRMQESRPVRVLSIAPDAGQAAVLGDWAREQAGGIPEAIEYLRCAAVEVVVLCFPIPEWNPAEALEELTRAGGGVPVIVCDPQIRPPEAVRLARLGAFQVLSAVRDAAELEPAIQAAAAEHRSRQAPTTAGEPWSHWLVGSSRPFQEVVHMVRQLGERRCTVLITGETGTGKEMVARALHQAGPRSRLPMVSVCCSALPENLLEAELFGHVRGAFTGAVNHRVGRFEQAHGSTLFLDEIGEMPLDVQAKLLRVLQEREFQRLGSSETVHVDVRVLAATNADLVERVRQNRFRQDLYYRLNVVSLHVPPLRERRGDVAVLAQHFLEKIAKAENLPPKEICREALERLAAHPWPGNVRELENALERAVVLSDERRVLYPSDFPRPAGSLRHQAALPATPLVQVPDDGLDFDETVGRIARSILQQALRKTNGNKKLAADMLRLKRTTLAAKLRSLDAEDPSSVVRGGSFVQAA
jgi:DNA-binding NtrC family response regulator